MLVPVSNIILDTDIILARESQNGIQVEIHLLELRKEFLKVG
jgi:hypothetical protein